MGLEEGQITWGCEPSNAI